MRFLKRFFHRKSRNTEPKIACFCPCGNELISNHVSLHDDGIYVRYVCGDCFSTSVWLFATPVPMYMFTVEEEDA